MLSPKGPDYYDFTPEKKAQIWAAIMKLRRDLACPVCHQQTWEMPDGFVSLPLLSNFLVGKTNVGLPSVAVVCTTCGHTLLFNLFALGLRELVSPDMGEMRKRWGLPPTS